MYQLPCTCEGEQRGACSSWHASLGLLTAIANALLARSIEFEPPALCRYLHPAIRNRLPSAVFQAITTHIFVANMKQGRKLLMPKGQDVDL